MPITLELWKRIIEFIEEIKLNQSTNGIMLCGSLPNNLYKSDSDIDVLCLSEEKDFSMICINSDEYLFDQMLARYPILSDILKEKTELSNVLSLSFGLHQLIIEDSENLRFLIEQSKENIIKRNLSYRRSENKTAHIINVEYTIKRIDNNYKLMKDDKIIL